MWKQLQLHEQSKIIFRVEIGASEKSAGISKIRDTKNVFLIYLRPTKF